MKYCMRRMRMGIYEELGVPDDGIALAQNSRICRTILHVRFAALARSSFLRRIKRL